MQSQPISVGDRVHTADRPFYEGTVVADYDNGIVRVEWHGITRPGISILGENTRDRFPLVTDVAVVALTRVAPDAR
jgi:hypothetical protein